MLSYVTVGIWNTRANRLWRILRVDTDISMDTESESCESGVPFKSLSALPVISTFHVDSLITSPGWLAVGTWNTGFTECKASEKYPQGRHRPTMEIWTRSRIHVTAAFLSSPQTAHRPEHIPRAGFPETETIMEVRTSPPHSSDYIKVISTTSRATMILDYVFRMLYLSALLYIKKRLTYYYVCITLITALLAYTHTEKAYFNGKTTNIDTKVLL